MENIEYDMQKRVLKAAVKGCAVTVLFETAPTEASIWHYVFEALSRRKKSACPAGRDSLRIKVSTRKGNDHKQSVLPLPRIGLGTGGENDIPMQRIACRTFAQERGWEVVKEFSEKGISGYKLTMKERDAILEIREDALAGKFDTLLVYMFDRIGRRDNETPFVVEWLVRNDVSVWSVCEGEQRFDNHVDKLTNYTIFAIGRPPGRAKRSSSVPAPGSAS